MRRANIGVFRRRSGVFRRSVGLVLPAIFLAWVAAARPAAAAQPGTGGTAGTAGTTGTAGEEEALIRRGVELRKARNDLAARAEFQKAYDLTHSPRAAAQLGLAEFALGRFDDAETHVSEALRAKGDPWITKYRKELDQSLVDLQNHVARVEVIGEPAGAEVFVNGRLSGRLPLENPVAVSEGQVDVELRAPGFVRGSRTITLSGHQYQRLVIRLERERGVPIAVPGSAGAGAATRGGDSPGAVASRPAVLGLASPGRGTESPAVESREREPSMGRRITKWTSLGLAGAGVVTGVAATVIAKTNLSTFRTTGQGRCSDQGGVAYYNMTAMTAPECQPSLDAFHQARKWQVAGFVAAGVFTATWLVLLLTEPSGSPAASRGSDTASWICAPTPATTTLGASCTSRF